MVATPEAMPTATTPSAPSRGVRGRIGSPIRKPLVRAGTPYLRELIEGAKLELIPMKSLERAITELRPNSSISMTCSPAKSIEATLDETERLTGHGHRVTPHISARMVRDRAHLDDVIARLADIGVRDIFVVGGDADPPGCFFDAIEFLDALLELDPAIDHIGYTSYPDTHPLISNDLLHAALHRKQEMILSTGRTAHVSTQMCFSADQIRDWLRRERDAGLTVPVHLGVPGIIDKTKLMTMGVRLGVGTSLRYLSKNRTAIGKLMTQRSYSPDQLLRPLSDNSDVGLAELGVGGLHLYTFNQVDATETWRERTLST